MCTWVSKLFWSVSNKNRTIQSKSDNNLTKWNKDSEHVVNGPYLWSTVYKGKETLMTSMTLDQVQIKSKNGSTKVVNYFGLYQTKADRIFFHKIRTVHSKLCNNRINTSCALSQSKKLYSFVMIWKGWIFTGRNPGMAEIDPFSHLSNQLEYRLGTNSVKNIVLLQAYF